MSKVASGYFCLACGAMFRGSHAVFKQPNKALMTMSENELRDKLIGPYCPECDSDNVQEKTNV